MTQASRTKDSKDSKDHGATRKDAPQSIEERYDEVRQLISIGKEKGYLLYDEVNDILPAEVHSSEEIDDLLTTFERYGIEV